MKTPIYGQELVNDGKIFTPFWKEPVVAKPSAFGGNNWPPSSYDPRLNHLFVCASDSIGIFTGGVEDEGEAGQIFHGGEFGFADIPRTGVFAAMDMATDKVVWQQRLVDGQMDLEYHHRRFVPPGRILLDWTTSVQK